MIYLDSFTFPDAEREADFLMSILRTCYDSFYPFRTLCVRQFERIDFEPVTILYGGNGSGKTTALNVIAEKLGLARDTVYNKTNFFPDYVKLCTARVEEEIPGHSRMITSDDVFDYMLNVRSMNEGIDRKREDLFEEYLDAKHAQFQMKSISDYEELKRINDARRKTQSRFVRGELIGNVREYSNGESAYRYFTEKIGDDGLYVLDEPENSLSPKRQLELKTYLEEAVRYFGCQLILSTHSPFLLAMRGAKIYDLDEDPVDIKRWTELEQVRVTYDFFMSHEREF